MKEKTIQVSKDGRIKITLGNGNVMISGSDFLKHAPNMEKNWRLYGEKAEGKSAPEK